MEGQAEAPRLLDQVRHVLRLHHYSIHTERSYIDWIKRYVHCHQMRCREDLVDGERKIEAFLTDLAVRGKVAASTQNQAMNALVFLCRKVLETYSRCRKNAPFPQTADTFLPGGRDAALHVRQGCLTLPCALGMKLFAIKYERFRMMAVNKPE